MEKSINEKEQCVQTDVMQSVLKASDLRVGNLINVLNPNTGIWNIESTKGKTIMIMQEEEGHYLLINNLKPIKPTKEILTKMGFFIVETNGTFEATLPNFRYSIQTAEDYDGFFFCDGETVLTNFDYLHELQNLVFVLGQRELTVA
jgi:hypothetical protein